MKYPVFNKSLKGQKPQVTDQDVIDLLHGKYEEDVFSYSMNNIRCIEASNRHNDVDIFYHNAKGEVCCYRHEDGLKPFLWTKKTNQEQFFSHNIIELSGEYVSLENGVAVINNQPRKIDGEDVAIIKTTETINGNVSHIVRYKFQSEKEREIVFNRKLTLYDIEVEHTVSNFDGDKVSSRMLNGFQRLVRIRNNKNNPKKSDNPYFNKTDITGCYKNLLDFFLEGGVSLRGNIYLNPKKLQSFIGNNTPEGNAKFLLNIYKWRRNFNPFTKDSFDIDGVIYLFSQYNVGGGRLSKEYIAEMIEKSSENFYNTLSKYDNPLNYFNVKLDNQKVMEYVIKCFTFDSSQDMKELLDVFKDQEKKKTKKAKNEKKQILSDTDDESVDRSPFAIDIFDVKEPIIYGVSPVEQYMIQTGRRYYKNVENYDELHALVMDIETEAQEKFIDLPTAALSAKTGRIFEIGLKDNRGFFQLLSASNDMQERAAIHKMWEYIARISPDTLITHNGEDFDFVFILDRMELLGMVSDDSFGKKGQKSAVAYVQNIFKKVYAELFPNVEFKSSQLFRRIENSNLKVGAENQKYTKTSIYGMNVVDTRHVMLRAKSQDTSIPNAKLKDCVKHAKLAKPNRVYVSGDNIGKLSSDKRKYYFNNETGNYFVCTKEIDFVNSYREEDVKQAGEDKYYYKTPKYLYVYEISPESKSKFISKCYNAVGLDITLDGKIISDENYEISKEVIDNSFDDLYTKIAELGDSIDGVIFVKSETGKQTLNRQPNAQKLVQYLGSKLKDLEESFNDTKNLYKSKDFDKYELVSGDYIVKRYLEDDLEEPYLLDKLYSQGTFEMSKWLPTTYERVATGGNASIWKLLLTTWSYLNCLTIPNFEEGRDFNGALIGMVEAGYHKKGVKKDYSSMYPSIFLTFVPVPDIDISNIYKPLVNFGLKTRLKYKNLKSQAAANGDKALALAYDKKQLPLKILINSFFGMLGTKVSPFSYFDAAQFITCVGRQHMRHMIEYYKPLGFKVVYFHTDGANFTIPNGAEDYSYIGKGINWNVVKDKQYSGVEAYVKEYNDRYMRGEMAVGLDGFFDVCINFAKGNFISVSKNKKGENEMKVTGGALYRDGLNEYIEDFLNIALEEYIFKNNPVGFADYYYFYANRIVSGDLPYRKIAKRDKIKRPIPDYIAGLKSGLYKRKLVAMELVIKHNLSGNVGDVIYYVNDGHDDDTTDKDMGDVKTLLGSFTFPSKDNLQMNMLSMFDESNFPFEDYNSLVETFNGKSVSEVIDILKEYTKQAHFRPKFAKPKGRKLIVDDELISKYFAEFLQSDSIEIKRDKNNENFVELYAVKHVLNCTYIPEEDLDRVGKYNAQKYLDKFNSAVSALLVLFNKNVRDGFLTDTGKRTNKQFWTEDELRFVSGIPISEDKQDNLDELMELAEEELEFWYKMKKSPNYCFDDIEIDTDCNYLVTDDNRIYKYYGGEYPQGIGDNPKEMTSKELIKFLGKFVIIGDVPYSFEDNVPMRA